MVVPSTISTDYVELEIELKPEVILHDPRLPLFEVGKTEYDKILVNYDENTVLSRYPRVQGKQDLQGVSVMAEGVNLFDHISPLTPFSATIVEQTPTKLVIEGNGLSKYIISERYKVKTNTDYTLSWEADNTSGVDALRISVRRGSDSNGLASYDGIGSQTKTFNTGNENKILFYIYAINSTATLQKKTYTNIMC